MNVCRDASVQLVGLANARHTDAREMPAEGDAAKRAVRVPSVLPCAFGCEHDQALEARCMSGPVASEPTVRVPPCRKRAVNQTFNPRIPFKFPFPDHPNIKAHTNSSKNPAHYDPLRANPLPSAEKFPCRFPRSREIPETGSQLTLRTRPIQG